MLIEENVACPLCKDGVLRASEKVIYCCKCDVVEFDGRFASTGKCKFSMFYDKDKFPNPITEDQVHGMLFKIFQNFINGDKDSFARHPNLDGYFLKIESVLPKLSKFPKELLDEPFFLKHIIRFLVDDLSEYEIYKKIKSKNLTKQ